MTKRYASKEKLRSAILVLDEKETASTTNFGHNEPFSEVGESGNQFLNGVTRESRTPVVAVKGLKRGILILFILINISSKFQKY